MIDSPSVPATVGMIVGNGIYPETFPALRQ